MKKLYDYLFGNDRLELPHYNTTLEEFCDKNNINIDNITEDNYTEFAYWVEACNLDEDTQMLLRTYAVLTGGTFIFLDDCSGIGGSHDVTIDDSEYDTEYLNAMLIRIIGEYCGVEIDAVEVEKPEIEETTADFQQ